LSPTTRRGGGCAARTSGRRAFVEERQRLALAVLEDLEIGHRQGTNRALVAAQYRHGQQHDISGRAKSLLARCAKRRGQNEDTACNPDSGHLGAL
jgi:hypothetical protein